VEDAAAMYDALMAGCIPLYYGDDLADIPKDIYIDIKKFNMSNSLKKHLQSLTIQKIQEMRERVMEKRGEVLRRPSSSYFVSPPTPPADFWPAP